MQLYSSRGDILYVDEVVLTADATFLTLIGSVSIKALIRSEPEGSILRGTPRHGVQFKL